MNIQWFPGHMLETKQFLTKAVSQVDLVMELIDARLPVSSSNPILNTLCRNVIRIRILNKSDLADPVVTRQWLHYFKGLTSDPVVAISGTDAADTWLAVEAGLANVNPSRSRRIRAMVVGIPNTGKSTLINTLAGKKIAKTGNVPAITRHQQRTSLKNRIDIYDTPGILWPVLEDKIGAYCLAASGAISDTAIDYTDIADFTARRLISRYPDLMKIRYSLSEPIPTDFESLMTAIGTSRGCLKKGGLIDYQRTSELLIREFRSGQIGRISLERPEDITTITTTERP